MKYWQRSNQKPSPFAKNKETNKSNSPDLTLTNEVGNVNIPNQSNSDELKITGNVASRLLNQVYNVRLTEQNIESLSKMIAKEIWKQMPGSITSFIESANNKDTDKKEKPLSDLPTPQKEKLVLTPAEAAELLSMSVNSVYKLIHNGKIPSVKLGMERKFLISRGELIKTLTNERIIK